MANCIVGDIVWYNGEQITRAEYEEILQAQRVEAAKATIKANEVKKPNIFVRFWNWLKGLFTKKPKPEEAQSSTNQTVKEFIDQFEIKVDDVAVRGHDGTEITVDDLYIDRTERGVLEDQVTNHAIPYQTFVMEPEVNMAIQYIDMIASNYAIYTPQYFAKVNEVLYNPVVQHGINKIITRYTTCYDILETREKGRWERLFSKIFLCYNVDKNNFSNNFTPTTPPADLYAHFYGLNGVFQNYEGYPPQGVDYIHVGQVNNYSPLNDPNVPMARP